MKKNINLLRFRLVATLLCLSALIAHAQDIKTKTETGIAATTNKLPDKAATPIAPAASNPVESKKSTTPQPGNITTLDGTTYKGVTVLKTDPDGLRIEYIPKSGGIGLAKIKFKNLSDELQRQYNYNPDNAAAYEAQQAQGKAAWSAQQQKESDAAKLIAVQRARQDALEQQNKEELARREPPPEREMTEQEKKEAQKEIEATWSKMKASLNGGRITN